MVRNDADMPCDVDPLRRILRRSWKLPELLRLDELRRVAVVRPAARGRRCVVKTCEAILDFMLNVEGRLIAKQAGFRAGHPDRMED